MTESADRVRHHLGPAALTLGGPLYAAWVDVLADELEPIARLVRSRPGRDGWADATDLDKTPALPWLLQWVGVTWRADLDDAANRARARDRPESRRGTPAYIKAVAAEYLTGGKRVELYERDGGNSRALRVRVFAAETPSQPVLLQALQRAVPWTIRLTLDVVTGWSVDQMLAAEPTVDNACTGFPLLDDLAYHLP